MVFVARISIYDVINQKISSTPAIARSKTKKARVRRAIVGELDRAAKVFRNFNFFVKKKFSPKIRKIWAISKSWKTCSRFWIDFRQSSLLKPTTQFILKKCFQKIDFPLLTYSSPLNQTTVESSLHERSLTTVKSCFSLQKTMITICSRNMLWLKNLR